MPYSKVRAFAVSILLLFTLAACQTTGIKKENINTTFAPKGWVIQKDGKFTIYRCLPSVCKSPQMVAIGPMKVKGDFEADIRRNKASSKLMKALFNVFSVGTNGAYKNLSVKRVSTPTYSGFEMIDRWRARGRTSYSASRMIIQKNRGSAVFSYAQNRALAKRNLRRFFAHTQISRR